MILSIYFLSLVLLILGWIYYFKPQLVQRINALFKDKVFNDVYILTKRKKIAIVFFLAACILSTSAFVHSREYENKRAPQPDTVNKEIIYDAIIHYKNGLMQNPGDATLLMKYADAYEALGDANKAAEIRRRILPQNAKNGAAEQSPEER